jgi:NagD protein
MKFFIDVQGTLIDDKDRKPISGSIDFINSLNEKEIPYIIITNNTKHNSKDFLNFLNQLGFFIDEDHYIDPLTVLKDILKEQRVAAYGVEEFLSVLKSLGYELDFKNPKAVLVSVKADFSITSIVPSPYYGQIIENNTTENILIKYPDINNLENIFIHITANE